MNTGVKPVLSSADQSLIRSAALALEAEGIAYIIQNEPGGALPFIPSSILVDDREFARARRILQGIKE